MPNRDIVYWDTCLFFALLKDEQRENPTDMPGLYSMVSEIDAGRISVVTSAITLEELNVRPLAPEAQDRLRAFLNRTNVDVVPLAQHMAERAAQLRGHYINNPGPKLCKEDARHLATAIVLNVSEFQTFDEADKPNCLGLIPLSGNVAGYPLRIVKPSGPQGDLGI